MGAAPVANPIEAAETLAEPSLPSSTALASAPVDMPSVDTAQAFDQGQISHASSVPSTSPVSAATATAAAAATVAAEVMKDAVATDDASANENEDTEMAE